MAMTPILIATNAYVALKRGDNEALSILQHASEIANSTIVPWGTYFVLNVPASDFPSPSSVLRPPLSIANDVVARLKWNPRLKVLVNASIADVDGFVSAY